MRGTDQSQYYVFVADTVVVCVELRLRDCFKFLSSRVPPWSLLLDCSNRRFSNRRPHQTLDWTTLYNNFKASKSALISTNLRLDTHLCKLRDAFLL